MQRIIVGVKYCFRYNARNRALRNGEEVDPITLENMPARPHRRRREKKLMTMEEVNERFPLMKYKNWVATRASEGLPTTGGVTAPTTSKPASLRNVEGAIPSAPVDTQHAAATKSDSSDAKYVDVTADPQTADFGEKAVEGTAATDAETTEEHNTLTKVQTSASTVHKHATTTSEEDDEDEEDDHIHTAVPPELLTNPGDSCAICIDTLEEDDDIRGLTCGHAYHAGCLDPWLTSRRACCPLCKADYYVPKPRPEGETVEAGTSARRRERMPQAPASAWTGIRGNTRLLLPGRFIGASGNEGASGFRRSRRARAEAAAAAAQPPVGGDAEAPQHVGSPPNTTRWAPRNPFRNLHMPSIPGRTRPTPTVGSEPSPSQLEAGTVR
jgi:hypothetical protein